MFICIPTKEAVETVTMAEAQNSAKPRLVEGVFTLQSSFHIGFVTASSVYPTACRK